MLIDVHAHFYHERTPLPGWREWNTRRLEIGDRIGITWHVGSVLGTWGYSSPIYLSSPTDITFGNDRMLELVEAHSDRLRAYVTVNPNFPEHAREEVERCVGRGAVGIKLAAARRATDPLLDDITRLAVRHELPILQHVWHHRRHDWPGQEASDGAELCALASRHPKAKFLLAHLGGGGDWQHSLRAAARQRNVFVDLSGSGADSGMLEAAIAAVGSSRLLWGSDITMDIAVAKLRYLERIGTPPQDLEKIRWRNAVALFPPGAFDAD